MHDPDESTFAEDCWALWQVAKIFIVLGLAVAGLVYQLAVVFG